MIPKVLVFLGMGVAACGGARPRVSSGPDLVIQPFDISSEASLYDVRGRLTGGVYLRSDRVTITVQNGSVMVVQGDSRIQLSALIAGPTARGWSIVAQSESRDLGRFAAGERRPLTDSLVFHIVLPSGLDLQHHWLAFQFATSRGTTTYACSERNLAGPDSLAATRAQQLRTFYPAAC